MLKKASVLLCVAIVALAPCIGSAPAVSAMIVSSKGPSADRYPTGMWIRPQQILLHKGDELMVMDESGTRRMRGPWSFSRQTQAARSMIADLMSIFHNRERKPVTIAVRDVKPAAGKELPNLWYFDPFSDGVWCARPATPLRLWRQDSSRDMDVTITIGPNKTELHWRAGEAVLLVPQAATGGSTNLRSMWTTGS